MKITVVLMGMDFSCLLCQKLRWDHEEAFGGVVVVQAPVRLWFG
jgi:hypothetical protein